MNRLSIVRIVTRLNIGGPAIHTILLTRELRALGYSTLLATGVCEAADGDMTYLLTPQDRVETIAPMSRSVNPWRNLQALLALWKLLRRERPLIVHTHTAMAGTLGRAAAILAGVPIIIHTFHGNSLRQYFSRAASAVFLAIERILARRTDIICVISQQQLHELSTEMGVAPLRKFRVIPLGLDLDAFLKLPPAAAAGVNQAVTRVAWFGRLVDVKNIGLLLDVARALRGSPHRFEFHVAGDGPDRVLIEAALPELAGSLVWHGWQRDITPTLVNCDLVIQTSRNEGTPVALIQAMAAGRPFVSTAVGGVVDMTVPNTESSAVTPGAVWFGNCVLVDANPEAFARALEALADAPEKTAAMGRSAREFASSRYPKKILVSNLDFLYRELLAAKGLASAGSAARAPA